MINNNHKFLSHPALLKIFKRDYQKGGIKGGYSSGFTLLELLIVVIIIGILVTMALPQYTTTIEKARSAEAIINIGTIRVALDRYWYQNGALPSDNDFTSLDVDNPNNITNKLYLYSFKNNGTVSSIRKYSVSAARLTDTNTWVKWIQADNFTGKLTRSVNLGGPTI